LQQAEQDYTKARAALKPELDDALVQAREFPALQTARDAIISADSVIETTASAQEFEKALELVKDLGTKVEAYLKDAKKKEDEYAKQGDEITKKLDATDWDHRDDVARDLAKNMSAEDIQHLPTPVRNRMLQELQEGNFEDEDKEACKKLYS